MGLRDRYEGFIGWRYLFLAAEPDTVVPRLLDELATERRPVRLLPPASAPAARSPPSDAGITVDELALALRQAAGTRAVSLLHQPLSWNGVPVYDAFEV